MYIRLRRILCITTLLLCICIGPVLAVDQGQEPVGEYGSIDWIAMQIRATGMGVAGPKAMNMAHARILAKGAAKVVAQRNLLEVVKGVHIDSETTVQNYMVQDDTITTRIQGVLKGATIEKYTFGPDNSCTATISIHLTGDLSRAILQNLPQADPARGQALGLEGKIAQLEQRIAALEQRINSLQQIKYEQEDLSRLFIQLVSLLAENQNARIQQTTFTTSGKLQTLEANQQNIRANLKMLSDRISRLEQGKEQVPGPNTQTANNAGYTGLIIDARGTGFRPCLRPKIFGQSRLLYPGPYIDQHTAISKGYVRFYRNLGQAQHSSLAGKLPYTVKATNSAKGLKRTLILPEDAGKELSAIIKDPNGFMSQCKVLVVF